MLHRITGSIILSACLICLIRLIHSKPPQWLVVSSYILHILGYRCVLLVVIKVHLGLALPLQLSLLLFPQFLVELSAGAGLVTVGLCGQSSINLAQTVLLAQLLVILLLALGLTLKLVGNGSLVLYRVVIMAVLE